MMTTPFPHAAGRAATGAVLLLAVALGLTRGGTLATSLRTNGLAVRTAAGVLGNAPPAPGDRASLSPDRAETSAMARLLAVLADHRDQPAAAGRLFRQALAGGGPEITQVAALQPASLALAEAAHAGDPGDPTAAVWLADNLVAPDPRRALALYQQATAREPADNLTWEKLGSLALQQGQNAIALDAFSQACNLNPVRNGSCHSAARLSYARRDWQHVVYYFERGSLPEHPADWALLIAAARKLGRPGEADRYLALAAARNPADYARLLQQLP